MSCSVSELPSGCRLRGGMGPQQQSSSNNSNNNAALSGNHPPGAVLRTQKTPCCFCWCCCCSCSWYVGRGHFRCNLFRKFKFLIRNYSPLPNKLFTSANAALLADPLPTRKQGEVVSILRLLRGEPQPTDLVYHHQATALIRFIIYSLVIRWDTAGVFNDPALVELFKTSVQVKFPLLRAALRLR